MKIVFFGTPEYVLPIIESLHRKFSGKHGESPIVAVVTQKPRPTGRKQILTYSAVDTWAHRHNVPIFFDCRDLIKEEVKADLGVLAAYGEFIPDKVIKLFPHGILNIHPSLLPEYRGASPVQGSIVAGDKITGGTIIRLDSLLDHGPIISQFKEEIKDDDTTKTLRERLFIRSAKVLVELLKPYLAGKIKPKEQNHKKAIFTREFKKDFSFLPSKYLKSALEGIKIKEEMEIPFIKDHAAIPDAPFLNDFIRATCPWPNAWTIIKIAHQEKRLKILKAHLEKERLILDLVQLEGKGIVSWEEFKRGYPEVSF